VKQMAEIVGRWPLCTPAQRAKRVTHVHITARANHDAAITVRVLSGADHSLRVPPADALGWPRYADGFPTLIVDWIRGLRR